MSKWEDLKKEWDKEACLDVLDVKVLCKQLMLVGMNNVCCVTQLLMIVVKVRHCEGYN